jgi:hypothetical protein
MKLMQDMEGIRVDEKKDMHVFDIFDGCGYN